jgi:hypothetical protein
MGGRRSRRTLAPRITETGEDLFMQRARQHQRQPLSWKRFKDLLRLNPLPRPTIRVRLWMTP